MYLRKACKLSEKTIVNYNDTRSVLTKIWSGCNVLLTYTVHEEEAG